MVFPACGKRYEDSRWSMPETESKDPVVYYDAHCHLQDHRLHPFLPEIISSLQSVGIQRIVVNATRQADWSSVLQLSERYKFVVPSFGLHPWYLNERSSNWLTGLRELLLHREAGVGEIGLDHWIESYDARDQESVFIDQLRLAAELDCPVSIHCLKAWGRLLEILKAEPRPESGFLLHSYGGPAEMISLFAELGGYFSFSGYFAHERKMRQQEVFKKVPLDRLLIETDAPDMVPPVLLQQFQLKGNAEILNHPGNLPSFYSFLAGLLNLEVPVLARMMERNFTRLYSRILPSHHDLAR